MAHSAYTLELDFTPQDLLANQMGEISERQRTLIQSTIATRQGYSQTATKWMILFLIGLWIAGVVIEFNNQGDGDFTRFIAANGAIFLMMGGMFASLMAVSMVFTAINDRRAGTMRLQMAEGYARVIVEERWMRSRKYMAYELVLKDGRRKKVFRFSSATPLEHFEEGKFYRVYYVNYYPLPMVLSAEPA